MELLILFIVASIASAVKKYSLKKSEINRQQTIKNKNNLYSDDPSKRKSDAERYFLNKRFSRPGKDTYSSVCWNCKSRIISSINIRCPVCGWYICDNCGSCCFGCSSGIKVFRQRRLSAENAKKEAEEKLIKRLEDARIKEQERKSSISFELSQLHIGSVISHSKFGEMEVIGINGDVFTVKTNGVIKRFGLSENLIDHILKIQN